MCLELDQVNSKLIVGKMPRRKQDCPKRMKWEEEMAALAAATGTVLPSFPKIEDDDNRSDDESGDSEDEPELKVDEEESKTTEAKDQGTPASTRAASQSPSSVSGRVPPTSSFEMPPVSSFFGGMGPPNLPPGFPMDALAQSFLFGGGMPSFLAGAGMFLPPNFPMSMGGLPYGHPFLAAFSNAQQQGTPLPPKSSPSPSEAATEPPPKKSEKTLPDGALDLSTYKRKEPSLDAMHESKYPRLEKTSATSKNGLKPPHMSPVAPSNVSPADATRALERMSELSRLPSERLAASRQSTWQNHWLSKGGDATRDVLKCVWCKQSFDSLAALTAHMRESKQCGMTAALASQSPGSMSSASSTPSKQSPRSGGGSSEIMKDGGVQLPRKLVRGQDVWLGKGAEQTRQILKCMWCGQSFRSLAEMTSHMQQTQHYTNIISQEQIISWKSTDEKGSSTPSHVNAVLTCKVCDQAFSSLKELSNHMVKNSHYKEHIMRSLSETGSKRRTARDKRKKALPVRKLLELERAQSDNQKEADMCEKCGDTINPDHPHACTPRSESKSFTSSHSPAPNDEARPSSSEAPAGSPTTVVDGSSASPSVLNALEKLIEKSFDGSRRNPSTGTSNMLKRLGIDDSHMLNDFSRPLLDNQFQLRHRNPSESTTASERSESKPMSPIVKEEKMEVEEPKRESPISVKPENPSPAPSSISDHSGLNALPTSPHSGPNALPSSPHSESGLTALGSMIDGLKPAGKAHPLAALQKLCDKTENSTPPPRPNGQGSAILAFSWACSDAITSDSVSIKCTFCDTQFVSKGAYRHHLSKVHFVKDNAKNSNVKASSQSPQPAPAEETPHAKFLKYSEMAKQLSSKYV